VLQSRVYTATGLILLIPFFVMCTITGILDGTPSLQVQKTFLGMFWVGIIVTLVGQWKSDSEKKNE